ncbi:MAG: flagellar basal body-associated FliL family protein [Nitrospirota bacterium]
MAGEKEEVNQEEEAEQKPAKGNKKNLIIIIAILVLAIAGGIGAYLFVSGGKKGEDVKAEEKKGTGKTALIPLDSFVVNLAEQGRFLKVTMQFEIGDTSNQQLVVDKTPQLRDAIITLVSSKSPEAVSSPEGKFQLKDELLLRVNQALGKEVFRNLYFTEFVMQ